MLLYERSTFTDFKALKQSWKKKKTYFRENTNENKRICDCILTMLGLQHLLEILLCFFLHDWLTGTDVCELIIIILIIVITSNVFLNLWYTVNCCNTHASWAADAPVLIPSTLRRQTSSSALCPYPDASDQQRHKDSQSEISCHSFTIRQWYWPFTHIICHLQILGFLTEKVEDIGEMFVSDFIKNLQKRESMDVWGKMIMITTSAVDGFPPVMVEPYPESSAWLLHFYRRR